MFEADPTQWAELIFGNAKLGDPRRTRRLTKMAADMATRSDGSVAEAAVDPASIEGAYRFFRNEVISPDTIAEAGFERTVAIASERPLVLALQDTTGLSYKHSVREELGEVNSASNKKASAKGRTLYAHSTLMLDADNEGVIGLANQYYWHREQKQTGKSHQLQCRERTEKESYKWQRGMETLAGRVDEMSHIIDVCDREADIYEYLAYQQQHQHRFVVRASDNRNVLDDETSSGKLHDVLQALAPVACYQVYVAQRGGRPDRTANVALSYTQLTIKKPQRANAEKTLTLNVVYCQELDQDRKDPLQWILYTSESLPNAAAALRIVRFYELRWRIEEFHRVWKSEGTKVEDVRMQTRENLRRVAVVKAFIAVRLMQLKEVAQNREDAKEVSCECLLTPIAWRLLWRKTEKKAAFPTQPPSLYWAYYALARLGRWHNTARNGRVGTKALWSGWFTLMNYVESYELFHGLDL
ncbi:IS4 family transposase [Oceanimonas marisflavi]|uniref:IS4 family transposase n=1 Tax=Oceanimonas marisflavi TaxID=2059724 RepID=UPI000D311EF1|nr:IS4 family transposase [Oceanimonas marisflavi]